MTPRSRHEPPAGNARAALFGAAVGFFVGFAAVALFGPTAKLLDDGMGMTSLQLGFLVAMPSLSGALLRIPFGAWVDVTGGQRPFLVLLVLSLIGMAGVTALLAFVGVENLTMAHYPLLVVFALLSGCGIATFSVGIGQVAYWFPLEGQGRALGTFAGLGNLAPGLFSLLIPLALGVMSMAGTYLVWSVMLLAGLVLYLITAPDAPYFQLVRRGVDAQEARRDAERMGQELFPQGGMWQGLGRAARVPETWALVFLYFTTFGGFLALTAWFPTYWQAYFGHGAALAGALTMTYSVLASLVRIPGGVLSDRIGGVRTVVFALAIMLTGALGLMLAGSLGTAVAGMVAMAIGMGWANAGVFKLVPRYVATAIGGGSGWVGGLGALGGFVIPPVMAWFVEVQGETGYATSFSVLAGLSVASLLVVAVLGRLERRKGRRAHA